MKSVRRQLNPLEPNYILPGHSDLEDAYYDSQHMMSQADLSQGLDQSQSMQRGQSL